jgi:hypothetical protein
MHRKKGKSGGNSGANGIRSKDRKKKTQRLLGVLPQKNINTANPLPDTP